MAGANVVFANEFVEAAADTYRANFPKTYLDTRDIREVSGADVLARCPGGQLDLLDGSPPCQSFSMARQIHEANFGETVAYSDTEQRCDDLFFEYARILGETMPRAFIAENVAGLARGRSRGYFKMVIEALRKPGYVVECRRLDASRLGVPQARLRLIFTGFREDLGLRPVFPKPGPRIGVADVLPYVAKVRHGGGPLNYRSARLPAPTIPVVGYTIPDIWSFSAGNTCVTIDGERRRWTIDELKMLFGFPSAFVLTGTEQQQWERLTRSVPPPMMRAIAETILAELRDQEQAA